MTKSHVQHGNAAAYPFLKIENANQIRGGCREIPHGVGRDASYPRAAAAALRAIGALPPALPKRSERSFVRENNMLTNPLTGKKNDDAQPTQEPAVIALTFLPLVPAKSDNPDRGILYQNPLNREFASPVNFRALKYTHRRYRVCTDCLHVNTLRNQ